MSPGHPAVSELKPLPKFTFWPKIRQAYKTIAHGRNVRLNPSKWATHAQKQKQEGRKGQETWTKGHEEPRV